MVPSFYIYSVQDRLLLLLVALAVSVMLGPALRRMIGADKLATYWFRRSLSLERKLNRAQRSKANLAYRGVIITGYVLLVGIVAGYALIGVTHNMPALLTACAYVVVLAFGLPHYQVVIVPRLVQKKLAQKDIISALRYIMPSDAAKIVRADASSAMRWSLNNAALHYGAHMIAACLFFLI